MTTLERIKKSHSTIGLLFATIFLIPFQTIFFIPFMIDTLAIASNQPEKLFSPNSEIFVAYIFLPILYCVSMSLLFFRPKRLVSPLNIQIGTLSVFLSYLLYYGIDNSLFTRQTIVNFVGNFIVLGAVFLAIGFFQSYVVVWVIGLNFEDNLDRMTYSINADFKTVVTKVLDIDFLKTYGFNRKRDIGKILVYKLHWPSGEKVVIALGRDPNNENKTTLATVAFQHERSSIFGSKQASNLRSDLITLLTKKLKKIDPSYDMSSIEKLDDPVSFRAFFHAKNPTRSKVEITQEFFREIPRYYATAIIITVIAYVGLSAIYWLQPWNFASDTYLSLSIVIFVALLTELGLSLREEMSQKKIEEIEDVK